MMDKFHFANILFSGPCNRTCSFCIGKQLPDHINKNTLDMFPLPGLDQFIQRVHAKKIPNIVFTGTISDPQLYQFQIPLLILLRENEMTKDCQYAIHTNAALALQQSHILNLYDKACFSIPSFDPVIYKKMMGNGNAPNLKKILEKINIPVKISCIVTRDNIYDIENFLTTCFEAGIKRIVFRNLFNDPSDWQLFSHLKPEYMFCNNPVYDIRGMEVTVWKFQNATTRSINLFPDGSITENYFITDI